MRVPVLILPEKIAKKVSRPLMPLGAALARAVPGLTYDLAHAGMGDEAQYAANALAHAFLYFLVFFSLFLLADRPLLILLALAAGISLLALGVALIYPRILAGKKAEQIEKHLVFSLKDLTLQVSSGIPLFAAIANIAKSGYGQASKEFEVIVQNVNAGLPLEKALEKQAVQSRSGFLRKTIWQLVNTIKAGASIEGALHSVIKELSEDQKRKIQNYGRELNLWSLLYMLFAVAIPSIGATLLVILSGFAGYGLSESAFITFIAATFIVQVILIGFVKSRRPVVTL